MNRYVIHKQINSGAFGSVFEALDKNNNTKVAIKKVYKKFYELNQKKKNREVKALKALSHPNIISLMDFIQKGNCLYFVFELMDFNLYEVIENRRGVPFPLLLIKFILHQILCGLKYLHNTGLFHRDIKPENILVSGSTVKIADFGLVRESEMNNKRLSKYVSTSWYRAPEIFFGYPNYNSAIDVWGVGAITAELITLKPLFAGKNDSEQIFLMCNVLGSPTESFSLGGKWAYGAQLAAVNDIRFPKVEEGALKSILLCYPFLDSLCIQFIISLLQYDPNLRLTASEALEHDFFNAINSNNNENLNIKNSNLSISYPYFPKDITNIDLSTNSLELPNIQVSPTISPFINGFISSAEELNSTCSSDKFTDPHSNVYNDISECNNDTSSFCSLNNLSPLLSKQNSQEAEHVTPDPVPFSLEKEEFQLFAPLKTNSNKSITIDKNIRRRRNSTVVIPNEKQTKTTQNRRYSLYDILDASELASFPISKSNNEPRMVESNNSPIPMSIYLNESNSTHLTPSNQSRFVLGLRRMSNMLSREFTNIRRASVNYKNASFNKKFTKHSRDVSLNVLGKQRATSVSTEPNSKDYKSYYQQDSNSTLDHDFKHFINTTFDDIATDSTFDNLTKDWNSVKQHTTIKPVTEIKYIVGKESFSPVTATVMSFNGLNHSKDIFQTNSHPENTNNINKFKQSRRLSVHLAFSKFKNIFKSTRKNE